MKNSIFLNLFVCLILVNSCKKGPEFDASGTFEAKEIIVSSEPSGTIKRLHIDEGYKLDQGQFIGYVDSTQLHLKKKELQARMSAILSKKPNIAKQVASLKTRLKAAQTERARIAKMARQDAATPQQLDDIETKVASLEDQIEAQLSSLNTSSESLSKEALPVQAQIEQLNDQIAKCQLINPIEGVVLNQYTEEGELVTNGKPLYKIANLDTLILRAYITGGQLPSLRLNQKVTVMVDNDTETYKNYNGWIRWISDKAEFTPKSVQTKDERANLVYAMKVEVPNDGFLKIGMYGEVKFTGMGHD